MIVLFELFELIELIELIQLCGIVEIERRSQEEEQQQEGNIPPVDHGNPCRIGHGKKLPTVTYFPLPQGQPAGQDYSGQG